VTARTGQTVLFFLGGGRLRTWNSFFDPFGKTRSSAAGHPGFDFDSHAELIRNLSEIDAVDGSPPPPQGICG
jgi:hypothetical protein